jgi:O-antigen ligase
VKDRVYYISSLAGEYGFYGLLFFLPISTSLVELLTGLILVSFIVRNVIKPDIRYLGSLPNFCLYGFLLFSALSMFNSGVYLDKSLHAYFTKWLQYIAICIAVQDIARDRRMLKRGISIFLFGASLVVLSGLSQYFYGVEFLRNRGIFFTYRGLKAATSSFFGNNAFGAYLVVVLSLAISQLITPGIRRLKSYSLLILALTSVMALFFTFSRGSWVAFSACLALVTVLSGNRFIRLIPVMYEIICLLPYRMFRERFLFIFRFGGDGERFLYWATALRMINDHPYFGIGVGTFMANYYNYKSSTFISYAHNCYLQIWAETGIFSLISFLAFLCALIYFGFKKYFHSSDFLLLGLLIGIVGFAIHMVFEVHLYSVQLAVLFWVWAGMIAGRLRDAGEVVAVGVGR